MNGDRAMKIGIILAAATSLAATPVLAQSATSGSGAIDQQTPTHSAQDPATAPAASGAAQASFTREEIASFAKAATKIGDIQQNAQLDDSQKQVAMAAAVKESGLDITRFNAMSQASRTDPALQKQVQAALSQAQGAESKSGAASPSGAQPAQ